jgi:hypothetical protein
MSLKEDIYAIVEELAEDIYWSWEHGPFACDFCGCIVEGDHSPHCLVTLANNVKNRLEGE